LVYRRRPAGGGGLCGWSRTVAAPAGGPGAGEVRADGPGRWPRPAGGGPGACRWSSPCRWRSPQPEVQLLSTAMGVVQLLSTAMGGDPEAGCGPGSSRPGQCRQPDPDGRGNADSRTRGSRRLNRLAPARGEGMPGSLWGLGRSGMWGTSRRGQDVQGSADGRTRDPGTAVVDAGARVRGRRCWGGPRPPWPGAGRAQATRTCEGCAIASHLDPAIQGRGPPGQVCGDLRTLRTLFQPNRRTNSIFSIYVKLLKLNTSI
jgi:hypothetical protein